MGQINFLASPIPRMVFGAASSSFPSTSPLTLVSRIHLWRNLLKRSYLTSFIGLFWGGIVFAIVSAATVLFPRIWTLVLVNRTSPLRIQSGGKTPWPGIGGWLILWEVSFQTIKPVMVSLTKMSSMPPSLNGVRIEILPIPPHRDESVNALPKPFQPVAKSGCVWRVFVCVDTRD